MAKKSNITLKDVSGKGGKRLRGAYAGTVGKGAKISLTRGDVEFIGETVIKAIRAEIKKDTAKAVGMRSKGAPVPLPKTEKFAASFSFRVRGERTLEFTSDWPTAEAHTSVPKPGEAPGKSNSATKPYRMTWLTRPAVPYAKIVTQEGEVIVRSTPGGSGDLWIHPGFKRYGFLARGIRKGKEAAYKELIRRKMPEILVASGIFK